VQVDRTDCRQNDRKHDEPLAAQRLSAKLTTNDVRHDRDHNQDDQDCVHGVSSSRGPPSSGPVTTLGMRASRDITARDYLRVEIGGPL
jgi:hypothetical protein